MRVKFALPVLALTALSVLPAAAEAGGQTRTTEPAASGAQAPAQPAATQAPRLPPEGSGPLVRFLELRFEPVNESLIEPQTYLYYIQTQPSRSGRRRLGALQRRDREDAARGLQAAVGDELPRQPAHRSARRAVPQRRDGQARHLPYGGAPARQDRRLHPRRQGGPHQDRREDEGGERRPPPRLVPRPGRGAPGRRHPART